MAVIEQFQQRRTLMGKTLQDLADLTAMSVPQVSNVLNGKVDSRISTYQALADAMDANLVLVPKHLLPEVARLYPVNLLARTMFRQLSTAYWGHE